MVVRGWMQVWNSIPTCWRETRVQVNTTQGDQGSHYRAFLQVQFVALSVAVRAAAPPGQVGEAFDRNLQDAQRQERMMAREQKEQQEVRPGPGRSASGVFRRW